MTKIILILFTFSWSFLSFGEDILGRKYFVNFLGHVHKKMSKDASSLTIVQCAHAVKILKSKMITNDWSYVQVGDDRGFVQSKFLSDKRPDCFQGKYPRFYNKVGLDITEMYYWGKLYDQYFMETSKIK